MANLQNTEYKVIKDIKIYTGTTVESRERYVRNIKYFKALNKDSEQIFQKPHPSTLTAQGQMSNISFDEKEIIDILTDPTGHMLLIGCNYGEKYNPTYVLPKVEKKSGRGRKPKPKIKTKRRSQGNGKYFSSQITFVIEHPQTKAIYKIKLFRNGVFQVPGVKDPSMSDLVEPICILREYLAYNFNEDVQVINFMSVMRNYKAKLLDESLRVDLVYLEDIINFYKNYKLFEPFLKHQISPLREHSRKKAMKFIGKSNLLNIAETNYNTDKCFCLNLKLRRPIPNDIDKKTTVKLLKKGKINFDGGNSEYEMLELYNWLRWVYSIYQKQILIDVSKIQNEYHLDKIKDPLIYSDDDEPDSDSDSDSECNSNSE